MQDSPFVDDYRALAAQEMELDTDVETARQVLEEAFHKLSLRRLEQERTERLAEFETGAVAGNVSPPIRTRTAPTCARAGRRQARPGRV